MTLTQPRLLWGLIGCLALLLALDCAASACPLTLTSTMLLHPPAHPPI